MSIAYLDPGNSKLFNHFYIILVAGDLDAGNSAGYRLIWALLGATGIGLFY